MISGFVQNICYTELIYLLIVETGISPQHHRGIWRVAQLVTLDRAAYIMLVLRYQQNVSSSMEGYAMLWWWFSSVWEHYYCGNTLYFTIFVLLEIVPYWSPITHNWIWTHKLKAKGWRWSCTTSSTSAVLNISLSTGEAAQIPARVHPQRR